MKSIYLILLAAWLLGAAADLSAQPIAQRASPQIIEADVCIYGGTSGGVAAAVQSARMGKHAVIAEPGGISAA